MISLPKEEWWEAWEDEEFRAWLNSIRFVDEEGNLLPQVIVPDPEDDDEDEELGKTPPRRGGA